MVKLMRLIPILILLTACATEPPRPVVYQTLGSACVAAQDRLEAVYERRLSLRQHIAVADVVDVVGPICRDQSPTSWLSPCTS